MKATSIFGGVQIFNIIIAIIRSKFVAVLLGPAGMGVVGLLNSSTGLISALTNFGLSTSSVKNVAVANATKDQTRVARVVTVIRRWVWITGLLGTLVTVALAPWLSELTFGNGDYTLSFIWISITLLFTQLSKGQLVILQGMRKLQYLAKANLLGSLIGLIINVPLYYLWGINAIVPAIISASIVSLLLSWYFADKVKIETIKVSKARTIAEGKDMLFMGFMISISGLITLGASYVVRIFISNVGGVEQVGLYSAGFTIVTTYVGLIFTTMSTDYYPRLSAVAHNNELCKEIINQQAEIAILILAPIIMIFLVYIDWIVVLLYSKRFIEVSGMIHWAAFGMLFKAVSWSIAFILLAKGATKVFFWNELLTNAYMLGLNILGYTLGGLEGLGISFMMSYVLYLLQVFVLARAKYSFNFSKELSEVLIVQLLLATICFLNVKVLVNPINYIIGSCLIILSVAYSFKELNRRLNILNHFRRNK